MLQKKGWTLDGNFKRPLIYGISWRLSIIISNSDDDHSPTLFIDDLILYMDGKTD